MASAAPESCPLERGIIWDANKIEAAKDRLAKGDTTLSPALETLMEEAEKAATQGPWSVTHKTKTPPSGDKRDYYSIGPYWWPDPKKKDGLPYIRRDGETNPERRTDAFDNMAMSRMADAVETLSLASYFGDRTDYGLRAAELLRVWFLNANTAMNPSLNFAQSIPGRTDGRGIGIIDTYNLVKVTDAAILLAKDGFLTEDEFRDLRLWFRDYSLWLVRSENGQEERMTKNNHALYYDAQLATFATFAGDTTVRPKILEDVSKKRVPSQIDLKGQMPHELKRTRPFHYTAFSLHALIDLAEMERCNEARPLYRTVKEKGRTLRAASDFQASYVGRMSVWPFDELRTPRMDRVFGNLCRGADAMQSDVQRQALARLRPHHEDERIRLLTNDCS